MLRRLRIDATSKGFRLRGTGRWAGHGDSWLLAHDVLHHLPGEDGSVYFELMTFGAELWMFQARYSLYAISGCNLQGVLTEALPSGKVNTAALQRFVLPDVPFDFRRLSGDRAKHIAWVVETGLCEFLSNIQDRRGELNQPELDESWGELIAGDQAQDRARRWVEFGYRVAQRRFPDPDAAAAVFDELMSYLAKNHEPQLLEFDLDEANCKLEPVNRAARLAVSTARQAMPKSSASAEA